MLLRAIRDVLVKAVPLTLVVEDAHTQDHTTVALLEAMMLQQSAASFLTPTKLLELFQGDQDGLLAMGAALAPSVDFAQVCSSPCRNVWLLCPMQSTKLWAVPQ